MKKLIILLILIISVFTENYGQYFGRNKPRYRTFDFKVVETPHYKIHHYMKNPEMVDYLAKVSEQWYDNHKKFSAKIFSLKIPSFL